LVPTCGTSSMASSCSRRAPTATAAHMLNPKASNQNRNSALVLQISANHS
jgi:hypothetical protein